MPSIAPSQLTLNFEASLPERYATLREFIAHRVQVQARPAKTIAGYMDMSPSTLSRKLSPGENDTQRFNVDDLETYMRETKDFSAIEYLAAKYLHSDEHRQARTIARIEALATEFNRALAALKGIA
jgi:hypothetical protein